MGGDYRGAFVYFENLEDRFPILFFVDERKNLEKILEVVRYVVAAYRFETRLVLEICFGDPGIELLDTVLYSTLTLLLRQHDLQ